MRASGYYLSKQIYGLMEKTSMLMFVEVLFEIDKLEIIKTYSNKWKDKISLGYPYNAMLYSNRKETIDMNNNMNGYQNYYIK